MGGELPGCIEAGGAYAERDEREQEHEKRHQPHGREFVTGQQADPMAFL